MRNMNNYVIVKDENDRNIKIEIILNFKLEEYNKEYIAYTLNDNETSDNAAVFISEIDPSTKKLLSIPVEQKDAVMEAYESAKALILENDE